MHTISRVHFRSDLIISETQSVGDRLKKYFIKDPKSGATFFLGEEELFLCRLLDESSNPEEIITSYGRSYSKILTEEDLTLFLQHISNLGLTESIPDSDAQFNPLTLTSDTEISESEELPKTEKLKLFNPESFFATSANFLRPFSLIIKGIAWLLLLALVPAAYLFVKDSNLLYQDLSAFNSQSSFIASILFTLFTTNLISKIFSGTVFSGFGGQVDEFGLYLRFGLIPRFYIHRLEIQEFDRQTKLWSYAAAILFRIALFTLGTLSWYSLRGSGTNLAVFAGLISQAGLIGFLDVSLPIRQSEGYKWLVTFFRLPSNLLSRSLEIAWKTVSFQPLPRSVSPAKKWIPVLTSSFLILIWIYFGYFIVSKVVSGIESTFPGIFGQATPVILLYIVLVFFARWIFVTFLSRTKLLESEDKNRPNTTAFKAANDSIIPGSSNPLTDFTKAIGSNPWTKYIVLFCIGFILILPFPYRPGGLLQILPPTQQVIQAPVEGKISQVLFNGGDGKRISKGTVIARIVSDDLSNKIQTLKESVNQSKAELGKKQAELGKKQAELAKLLTGPKQEEVAVLQAQINVARDDVASALANQETSQEEVKVIKKQIDAAITTDKYNDSELKRLDILYKEGAIALGLVEESRRNADLSKIQIDELNQQVRAKESAVNSLAQEVASKSNSLKQNQEQLKLLLSDAYPEDVEAARREIEAARQDTEAAGADLKRSKQELKYALTQQVSTNLTMPLDGYLFDSFLQQKIGSYLNQGQTFATVQDSNQLLGEIQVPEYDAGAIKLKDSVEVKLLGYSDKPFSGQVVAIEPSSTPANANQTVESPEYRIRINLKSPPQTLKPGMTGYGKIDAGEMPLIMLLIRPIVRFVQVEMWSWLP